MTGFDVAVVVLTGVLMVLGLLKGMVRVLVGLGALVVAFILASRFHRPVGNWLSGATDWPEGVMLLLAYTAIFLGVMLAGGVAAWMVRNLVKAAMLSWADRLAGAALGLAVAALTASLLVLPMVAYMPAGDSLLRDSLTVPYLVVITDLVYRLAPEDLSREYREKVEELRRWWSGERVAGV